MSDDPARLAQNGKRRRLQGACDMCRQRKVRCDSAEMPGNRCTNCITVGTECIHNRSKEPDKSSAPSAQTLKNAQEHVASILSTSIVYIPSDDPIRSHRILVEVAQYARSLEEKVAALQPQTPVPMTAKPGCLPEDQSSPEASGTVMDLDEHSRISDPLTGLIPFASQPVTRRFAGKSSSVQFVKNAIKHIHGGASYVVGAQRLEFWTVQPWEKLVIEPSQHFFPENDLMKTLVKIYFDQINPLLGILHFPSFHQSFSDGLHFRDHGFGAIVLVVCSLASRYSDDPRVFLDEANSEHSCGWKWFRQVRPLRASFSPEPSLYQLQLVCLSIVYLASTSTPEECWILAGLGIRFAQGAGAHHRSTYSKMEPLEAELYKRVFWLLVVSDMSMSSFKGRPSMTNVDNFDVDLPVDCDDVYWGIPNAVQPRGKPSSSAFLVAYLRLMLIFGRIQGAIYPVDGNICSHEVVTELDSELNKWVDSIPDHLRWDPHQENQVFLDQSAALYATYYHAQILIHRTFIPAPGKESMSNTPFPSLAICANAARSCGHVLDVQTRRGRGLLHHPQVMTVLFDCAVVLLVNVWAVVGGRKSRTREDFNCATADAQNCVRVLRLYERRWRVAGRRCDIISAMLNLGKYTSDGPSLKRTRDPEEHIPPPHVSQISLNEPEEYVTAGSMTVTEKLQALQLSIRETDHLFALPLHTEELGRLAVYDSFNYEFPFQPNDMHYQSQSHLPHQYGGLAGPIEPELIYGIDAVYPAVYPTSAMGSNFHPQQGMTGGVHMQLPPSFDIPSGDDSWGDWSAYLTSVDGLYDSGDP
ncbi:fungal-specific transcription factor domain-containing protein [Mycena epipterygia]|nr:fungal-specific transcription factor domain-containing protein [Mycena epipterygia]